MLKLNIPEPVCRAGCGACCIAPSLSSRIPGMLEGKVAGVRCVQLTSDNLCGIYGKPERPAVCASYKATVEFCGASQGDALRILAELEQITGALPVRTVLRKINN